MKRHYMVLCAAAIVAACGRSTGPAPAAPASAAPAQAAPAPAPTEASAPAPATPKPDEAAVASSRGTKLRFFANVLDTDQPQKPSFELEADRSAMTQDNVWVVEKARAAAYGKDGSETTFEADSGRFDDNNKTTQLDGNVTCSVGTQRVEMKNVTWTNETKTAATSDPVVVSDGDTKLSAGSMEYNTDTKRLRLPTLSGTVSLKAASAAPGAAPAADAAGAGVFDFIDIKKGGLGEFVDGRLQHISGGVEIALRPADAAEKPMVLAAEKVEFQWDEGNRSQPKAIELEGRVNVDGPQGLITSDRASLRLAANQIEFAGNVKGKSDSIQSFDASRLVYDTKSGDAEMTDLVARGIDVGAPAGAQKAGQTDFSSMNVERAGKVISHAGQVKTMSGGVVISMLPRDAKAKPLKLAAGDAAFSWSGEGGQPTAIAMHGKVRVDGPQGAILADRGDFDLAKKQLVFSGNVNGSMPQLEHFDAEKLSYNIESGETLMTVVSAKGLAIGAAPGAAAQPPQAPQDGTKDYSRMDIESAPEVSLTGQRLNWMRGGVSLAMRTEDPNDPPMTVKAGELTFAYGEKDASPQKIVLKQDVSMNMPERSVKSDQAVLDVAANTLVFSGNVLVATPQVSDLTATQFTYDMKTRQVSMKGSRAARMSMKPQDGTKQP